MHSYISCLQFFVAPTRLDGTEPRPELAAHGMRLRPLTWSPARGFLSYNTRCTVVTNSYGCPPEEGCSPASLTSAVNAVVANGIFFVASAGNTGPRCGTGMHHHRCNYNDCTMLITCAVSSPPAIIERTFSVAAAQKESYARRGFPIAMLHLSRLTTTQRFNCVVQ